VSPGGARKDRVVCKLEVSLPDRRAREFGRLEKHDPSAFFPIFKLCPRLAISNSKPTTTTMLGPAQHVAMLSERKDPPVRRVLMHFSVVWLCLFWE
jgi:hypothetical protein